MNNDNFFLLKFYENYLIFSHKIILLKIKFNKNNNLLKTKYSIHKYKFFNLYNIINNNIKNYYLYIFKIINNNKIIIISKMFSILNVKLYC